MQAFDLYEQNASLIHAAEDWANVYRKNPESFAMLIKAEASLERKLLEYFKGLAERVPNHINWSQYNRKLAEVTAAADDFNVEVMVEFVPDGDDALVMQIIYTPIESAATAGFLAGESTYGVIIPQETVRDLINKITKDKVAYLVGRRVDESGNIIPAKNPEYHINEITRKQIVDSIRTSLSIGENQESAVERLSRIIKDPRRAAKIASTEAVNAYGSSEYEYATTSGAKLKEWQTRPGACPICLGNQAAGPIKLKSRFPSGHLYPSAHPWDRCGLRYIYPEELEP